jgi:serine/threonine protein kinase
VTEIDAHLAASLAHRFRLVRRVGEGGMGAVFLAEQIAVGNRPVALKVLNRKLLDDPNFLLRFQNEAASTGRIHHPNVVTIYESGQADDGTPYIAMEFLEGESLAQALTRRGPLPVAEVAEILQQAARGLNAAHKLGIIHRDLKPDNIFLTYPDDAAAPLAGAHDVGAGLVPALPVGIADAGRPQGPPLRPVVVKLVDFGIAKLRESGAHTQTGMVLGTPAYMSFEQAFGMRSDELDARSDVYSLGVVVYEMLTGRTPFRSDTPVGYLRMHMQEDPPPFRAVKPDLPALPQVESVVMKALTKDRVRRSGSVLELAREFAQAAASSDLLDSEIAGFKPGGGVHGPTRAVAINPFVLVRTIASDQSKVVWVAFSPGGRLLASGSLDKTIRFWDVATGGLRHSLKGFLGYVNSVAFSPDGKFLAAADVDNTIKLWLVATGRLWRTLTGHAAWSYSVAFSPAGGLLASAGGADRTVNLWDVATGRLMHTLKGHADQVVAIAFSPDGDLLGSASWDRTVKLWDVPAGTLRRTLTGHDETVESVTFSPDPRLLASSAGKTIRLWDVATGKLMHMLTGHADHVQSVSFNPDGKLLASAGTLDKTFNLWDVESGTLMKSLTAHESAAWSVVFSPDGRLLASAGLGKTVNLWDVPSGTLRQTLSGHSDKVTSFAFSPDGKLFASGSYDSTIKVWLVPQ